MFLLKLIAWLLNLEWEIRRWRLDLCFWTGAILSVGIVVLVQHEPLCWILGGAMMAVWLVIGWIWDDRSRNP